MSSFYKKDQAKSQNDNRIYYLYSSHFHLNVDCQTPLTKEWSLKGKKKRTVFSDNSNRRISWFHSLSDRRTGSKVDQFDAAKAMQREMNDVEYVFSAAEYLTGQHFSRLSMKDRSMDILDLRAFQVENEKSNLKYEVLNAISEK